MKVAVCPGSFDPVTNGHIDVINRASSLFDKIVVGVTVSTEKHPTFTLDERVKLIKNALLENGKVIVESYNTLLIDFAKKHGAKAIIRGLRATSDFEREFQIAQFNKKLEPDIETLFIMSRPEYAYLSSSAVKEVAKYGGNVSFYVPENVEKELKKRLK
jgi:pantetheine-phosphate adenylyltransferase